jgi:Tat protein translocase TatB subunit
MFGTLGAQEIFLILVIALIVFGPRKLPEIGKNIGRMMAEFRKASNDFRRTLEEEVEAEKLRPAETTPAVTPAGSSQMGYGGSPAQTSYGDPPAQTGYGESPSQTGASAPAADSPAADPSRSSAPESPSHAGERPAAPLTPAPPDAPTVGRPDARPVEPR